MKGKEKTIVCFITFRLIIVGIYSDLNHNGQLDDDEPGLAGVTIYLDLNDNGMLEDESDGDLSLREALELANANPGADSVSFDASLAGGLIRLVEGQLLITDALALDGGTLDITITADANGDDTLLAGTYITDVAASESAGTLSDNSRVLRISGSGSTFFCSAIASLD